MGEHPLRQHPLLLYSLLSLGVKVCLMISGVFCEGIRTRCWIVTLYSTALALFVVSIVLSPLLWVVTGGNPLLKLTFGIGRKAGAVLDGYMEKRAALKIAAAL